MSTRDEIDMGIGDVIERDKSLFDDLSEYFFREKKKTKFIDRTDYLML